MSPLIVGTREGLRFRLKGERMPRKPWWRPMKKSIVGVEDPSGNQVLIMTEAISYIAVVPQDQLDAAQKAMEQGQADKSRIVQPSMLIPQKRQH